MPTILNGVEYAHIPPPSDLWRATKYAYAMDLINSGILYLTNAWEYREDSDPERGDSTETDGRFIRQEAPCTTGHSNPIFLLCTTLDPDPDSVLAMWHDCDTVIHIHDPKTLAGRILNAAKKQGIDGVSFHAGTPTYDKDHGGTSPYRWDESIFQKPEKYILQNEYRFALVGSYSMHGIPNIKLTLGPCGDIIKIIKRR